jgi:putative phosphoribosyl transferase
VTSLAKTFTQHRGRFADRAEAAGLLAERLSAMKLAPPIVVLALPRGGVPMGAIVARLLGGALDLVLVRKIGVPWQPELAVAAVAEGAPPVVVVDEEIRAATQLDVDTIDERARSEMREIARRRAVYLRGRAPVSVKGCTVIVVDDGIATGTTMRAALKAVRRRAPARLVMAVPVAPSGTLAALRDEVDDVVCLAQPFPFHAVGEHYDRFDQVDDAEVIAAMDSMRGASAA